MKKIAYLFLLLIITGSCEKFYEEDLTYLITPESGAYSNVQGLTSALVGTYRPFASTWVTGFANASTAAILMGGDDLTTHKASNKADFREFDQFVVTNQNQRLPFVWSGCYKTIQGANGIISNYEKTAGDQATISQIAGEAFFLRAYAYFWVVRLWGKAPLVLNSNVYDEKLLSIPSSSESDIYAQIISDLKKAETLMAPKKVKPGRASKGTASAVLAEVYLNMAGWPLNDASKYSLAASKAKEVIDNQITYGFGLMNDFKELWPTSTLNSDGNKEEVFALTFYGADWFNANAYYGIAARPAEEGGWDDYMSELRFYNDFPSGYRKDVTFMTSYNGIPYTAFQTGRPYYKKLQGPTLNWQNVVNMPLERFAETLFIFAEAQIKATGNGSDPLALEAFNKIKRRGAGLPPNTPNPTVDATTLTVNDIITEKGWEFAGEYCRWFDLVRLQKVQEVINKKDPNDLQPQGPITYYMPLPVVETLTNPNL